MFQFSKSLFNFPDKPRPIPCLQYPKFTAAVRSATIQIMSSKPPSLNFIFLRSRNYFHTLQYSLILGQSNNSNDNLILC